MKSITYELIGRVVLFKYWENGGHNHVVWLRRVNVLGNSWDLFSILR
jgi:hypothetical protein